MKTKTEFVKKYDAVIRSIATANGMDLDVGCDMLISTVKNHFGMTYVGAGVRNLFDAYAGIPANFDFAECLGDWLDVISVK